MKTVRHIITWDCNRDCPYCINKKLSEVNRHPITSGIGHGLATAYGELGRRGYDHIMLTGGEPTLVDFPYYARTARQMQFKKVSLITANPAVLTGQYNTDDLDDILFSIHNPVRQPKDAALVPDIIRDRLPVYASMVLSNFCGRRTIEALFACGFDGLSIREEYPDGWEASDLIPTYANFSVRYSRKRDCFKADTMTPDFVMLRPDDFTN